MPACSVHTEREATQACERCGAFVCEGCLPPRGRSWCASCRQRTLSDARASWTNRAVRVLAAVVQAAFLGSLLIDVVLLGLHATSVELPPAGESALTIVRVVTQLCVIAWTGIATAQAKRRGWPVGSAGWAATSWLVPGVSFVVPFLAIAKLVAPARRGSVWAWAVLSGVTLVLSLVVSGMVTVEQSATAQQRAVETATELLQALVPLTLVLQALHEVAGLRTVRDSEDARTEDEAVLAS